MAELLSTTPLVRNQEVVGAEFSDGLMMLDIASGTYYELNATARAIWEQLAEPATVGQLVSALQQQFDGADDIEGPIQTALEHLSELGLVSVNEPR